MDQLILLLISALAIERFVHISTTVDLLEGCRTWWEKTFPKLGKLATCKLCLAFWTCGLFSLVAPYPMITSFAGGVLGWIICWLSTWGVALFWDEFLDRYLNRAPISIFLHQGNDPTGD